MSKQDSGRVRASSTSRQVNSAPVEMCGKHNIPLLHADCHNCDNGFTGHDCGEDTCCCADPDDNVRCDICRGKGSILLCPECAPAADFF